uniref:Alpha-macroglobulin receptor-binding domain-containing protein n=1 Tax=Paramormyrops kingsleyae TaxID=1676925 RepID=A0A3B3QBX0_9TELE
MKGFLRFGQLVEQCDSFRSSFLVTFPGVIPTGSETKFCSLLLHVNEMLQLTVSLVDGNQTTVLQEVHSDKDIYQCSHFQPPKVSVESIQVIRVELRGQDLQLVKETNVRIKPATPISFIQTDKPIYKPGQTATVFNYLPKCIMVTVTAAPSTDYTLQACPGCQYSNCLCASERKTFKWVLVPSALGAVNVSISAEASSTETLCNNEVVSIPDRGRIDRVTRTLLVKVSNARLGIRHFNLWLISASESVQLQLPENVVEGSTRVTFSVLGDILGHALQNVENLLRMPYGCGEQNMVLLAPNIYLLHYLKATNQLTPATHEKATGFLKSGYQRQLNYKHHNGAFSTFGSGSGNNWLTAFVAKSFTSAQEFIYIEPKQMKEAHSWLFTTQKPDGCFLTVGKLFNNRMKGGVDDDVTLTAYITAAFLESKMSVSTLIRASLACLRSDSSYLTNTYTTALLAYTFSLAGDQEKRAQLLDHLKKISEGGLHWSQSSSEKSEALSVEISSYVLLAVLATSPLTSTDLGYATKIVQWLVRQQNEYGGFSSTQDTVLALQALSVYATAVYSPDGSSTVSVQSAGAEQHHFTVNEDNRLLYQERALQDPQGLYSIAVQGTSCVSAQLVLHYNIPTPTLSTTFSVVTNTNSDCKHSSVFFCCRYNGLMNNTNMVIVDVGMLSGFVPMLHICISQLKTSISIDRVDVEDDHVIIYVAELHRDIPLTYTLQLEQQVNVKDLKPAIVKMYDYYQTSKDIPHMGTSRCRLSLSHRPLSA